MQPPCLGEFALGAEFDERPTKCLLSSAGCNLGRRWQGCGWRVNGSRFGHLTAGGSYGLYDSGLGADVAIKHAMMDKTGIVLQRLI